MNMKHLIRIVTLSLAVAVAASCTGYRKVAGDPMESRIYTLDNGLKVYMTVNKDLPRIQTYIAVRVGGKNDPSDNTGLAHYLEHMMFKGTGQFGTSDYAAEKPMLDQIDSLFEVYRTKTVEAERLAIYHEIDSISYEASKLAIPNEYDKLMAIIGSEGSNAYTSNDVTCYVEDIPSNQLENWARIESDRFMNCVFRGFHTELEAVYEEKNMGLTDDNDKALDALDSMLFVHHPYGTQTVIGTQEHLKNPSLRTIRTHKDTYYVPDNCAICLSGDLDPDKTIRIIRKYFGPWTRSGNVPALEVEAEEPITTPRSKTVLGNEAEFVLMGWRTPGAGSQESDLSEIAGSVLFNGMAGLIDLDVIQKQKILDTYLFPYDRADYGAFIMMGMPKAGQSLEEVRDILLEEVAKLRNGEFSDSLVSAVINNYKLDAMKKLQDNSSRADMFVDSFVNGTTWESEVGKLGRIEKATRDDIVAWAGKYLGENSYAVVYKKIGEDLSIKKIDAPKITPIVTNRDMRSPFLEQIASAEPAPIEPVFTDYSKDMSKFQDQGLEVLYKKNEKNDIASLTFYFETGTSGDPALNLAAGYIGYLGTPTRTAEEIAATMYGLACDFNVRSDENSTVIRISGLSENMGDALQVVEDLVHNAQPDPFILEVLKEDLLKDRADSKMNQAACFRALMKYVTYGPEFIRKTTLTNAAVSAITPEELTGKIAGLTAKKHRILYYGPASEEEVAAMLDKYHSVPAQPEEVTPSWPAKVLTPETTVVIAPYKSRQFRYVQYSDRGETLETCEYPGIDLFNEYFGGGMNAIVFQEMRESRALAYSAGAYLYSPSFKDDSYSFNAYISSQNDKLHQAVEAFDQIINDMPQSDKNLEIARTSILSRIRTQRNLGESVLTGYLADERIGLSEPNDRMIFEKVGQMSMDDLMAVQHKWVKDRTYTYAILGDESDLDMAFLRSLGPVKKVSLEDIFGY